MENTRKTRSQVFFFIIGSQRSGTTLTKLILDSHREFKVYDEFQYGDSYGRIKNKKYSQKHKFVGFKVPILTSRYAYLSRKFPGAKYIFLRRDILSVVNSMITLKSSSEKDKTWIEKNGIIDLRNSIKYIPEKKKRDKLKRIMQKLAKERDLIGLATMCALVKENFFKEYKKRNLEVLQIDYGELVKKKGKTIRKIIDFLGAYWDENLLKHHLINKGSSIGGTENTRKIDTKSMEKWKGKLKKEDILRIRNFEKLIGPILSAQ
jgi:hypothetical protein